MSASTEQDEIIRLLKIPKTSEGAISALKKRYSDAEFLYREMSEDVIKIKREAGFETWEDIWRDYRQTFDLENLLRDRVLGQIQKPLRIDLDDLVFELVQLCGIDPEDMNDSEIDFDLIYKIFVHKLKNHVLTWRRSEPFPICRIPHSDYSETLADNPVVWAKNNVQLSIHGEGVADRYKSIVGEEIIRWTSLHAIVEGPMSFRAAEELKRELEKVVPSVFRSAALLEKRNSKDGFSKVLDYPSDLNLQETDEKTIRRRAPFLCSCLDAFYTTVTKKDSMDRRIRNAVHLLVEADDQRNYAIALSLNVASIEALLGKNTSEMAEKLGNNIAVLLEPKTEKRRGAVDFFKELYEIRSKALHGERIDGEALTRSRSRHLAAAVLDQVVARRDFRRKGGYDPETPDDLLSTLRDNQYNPGQQGLEVTNARFLWGG